MEVNIMSEKLVFACFVPVNTYTALETLCYLKLQASDTQNIAVYIMLTPAKVYFIESFGLKI